MATTKTLSGAEILTGAAFDAISLYAPTVQLAIFSPFAGSTVVYNALIGSKTGPVYDVWNSATFDPNAASINLSFTSNTGSKLTTSHSANQSSIALTSGDKNITFNGSAVSSGSIWDSNGNYKNGVFVYDQNFGYSDTKGTSSQLDDTNSYLNIKVTQTALVQNGLTNLQIKGEGTATYWANGNYLAIGLSEINDNTVVGNGSSAVWTTHSTTLNFSNYAYWSETYGLTFSGAVIGNLDTKTESIDLNNVAIYDHATGSKTTASHVVASLTNIVPGDINLGIGTNDDPSGVQASVTKYILPIVLNSGVIVTSTTALGSILNGGSNNDAITGGDGKDTISGRGGNDTIDGGLGVNTAVYSGKFSDYVIKAASSGTYTISDSVSSRDGTDTLTNIQNLQFSDVTKAIADIFNTGGGTPATPTLTVPASVNLLANQSMNVGNWFAPQTSKAGAPIDLWIFYETGSGLGASNGHVHVNNGYILQNNVWSVFSGDVPAQTLVAVTGADFAQTTYSAPKFVGVHDDLYAGFLSGGLWSNTAHTTINT